MKQIRVEESKKKTKRNFLFTKEDFSQFIIVNLHNFDRANILEYFDNVEKFSIVCWKDDKGTVSVFIENLKQPVQIGDNSDVLSANLFHAKF